MLFSRFRHLRTDGDVQSRDGLVGHDELRLHDQRTGDADTLTLAARELVGEAGGELRQQADLVQSVHDLFVQVILVLVQVVVQQTLSTMYSTLARSFREAMGPGRSSAPCG